MVTQHYDTLQAIGADTNSNLILLPNSPQAGSDMLNNMVASFTASNQIGETMKNQPKRAKKKMITHQRIIIQVILAKRNKKINIQKPPFLQLVVFLLF